MDCGVVYLLAGDSYAELLAVSLHSLRRHFAGAVTVFTADAAAERIVRRMAEDRRLDLDQRGCELALVRRHAAYVTKPTLTRLSPYERTVFLDADTVVQDNIDRLFEPTLAITQFLTWHTGGRKIGGRVRGWQGLSPYCDALVERALAQNWPAINTGVVGWHKDFRGLPDWRALTMLGGQHRRHMTDELAMQLLYPSWPGECQVFNDRWNCSARLGGAHSSARILHFHGRTHVRQSAGWELWRPHWERAMVADAGGLMEWGGRHDRAVGRKWRAERQQRTSDLETSVAA